MTNVKDKIMGSTSDAYQTAGSATSGMGERRQRPGFGRAGHRRFRGLVGR